MNAPVPDRGKALVSGGRSLSMGPHWLARIWSGGVQRVLDRIDAGLARGSIEATLPDGTTRLLGGRAPGFDAQVKLNSYRALARLATGGSVGWYQAWEAGEWDSPDPVSLFALFMDNGDELGDVGRSRGPWRLAARFIHWLNRNTRAGALRNIHVHYDLGNDFYRQWLGSTKLYSSALFEGQDFSGSLEDAQRAKMAAIIDRLQLKEGGRALEIGCGWGALAFGIASKGVHIDAISLSDEQLASCRERPAPLKGSINFHKQDYRDLDRQYDAIASVEMVEALGREYWPAFMDCLQRCLKPGGRAALQFISLKESLFEGYARSADFIQTYIFPGGLLIKTSEFRRLAQERGLKWTEQVDFGLHYADTLRHWRENFDLAVQEGRLPAGFDEHFVRLWRYYLMYCEGGFRGGGIDVSQVTLVKSA